jgi:hypothetical protein
MVDFVLTHREIVQILAIAEVSPITKSGGNSTIKRVAFVGREYAVKDYSSRSNGKERLTQEFSALRLVHPALPSHFPEPLGVLDGGLQAVYSWIDGVCPALEERTVKCMLSLAHDLHGLSRRVAVQDALPATDQVLVPGDIVLQVRTRARALASASNEVAEISRTQLLPALDQLAEVGSNAGPPVLTLSLSDFGAHNLLWDEKEQLMRCVDLEFFGWDDAHKLTADALLHPLASWTPACAETFLSGAFSVYQLDEQRLLGLWPYLSLKWATITLARAARNLQAGSAPGAAEAMHRAHTYVSYARHSPRTLRDIVCQVADV